MDCRTKNILDFIFALRENTGNRIPDVPIDIADCSFPEFVSGLREKGFRAFTLSYHGPDIYELLAQLQDEGCRLLLVTSVTSAMRESVPAILIEL